jgi:hypothetical protein
VPARPVMNARAVIGAGYSVFRRSGSLVRRLAVIPGREL